MTVTIIEFMAIYGREKGYVTIDVKFWANLLMFLDFEKVIDHRGRELTKEGCFKEMEECVMKEAIINPLSLHDFLFNSWLDHGNQDIHPTGGYDDWWDLRHALLCYHFKQSGRAITINH